MRVRESAGDRAEETSAVVAPGMLENASVRTWLGGVEPVWTLLDQASFSALHHPPSPAAGPIRLAADLTRDELRRSAVARNALLLLRAAATGSGLRLTATGNLSRAVVARMGDMFDWPGFDRAEAFRFHKAVNEPDFFPLFLLRQLVEAGRLLRRGKGLLRTTPAGRRMLETADQGALQALLFHVAFWHLDLAPLGRGLLHNWPQRDAGVVLWCLSVAAAGWESRERLTRMCTIPVNGVLDHPWDVGSWAMDARILRPLWWFGLLEHRDEDVEGGRLEKRHLYRKSPLFDRFLSFDVRLDAVGGVRH